MTSHSQAPQHLALSTVTSRRELAPGLVILRFHNPTVRGKRSPDNLSMSSKAGFLDPMLRRPFSVYNTTGDEAEIIVQAHGRGTGILAGTREGELLDVLGPWEGRGMLSLAITKRRCCLSVELALHRCHC